MLKLAASWICVAALGAAQQPNYINRLVATVREPVSGGHQIAFTDAETGETVKHFLPKGMFPGTLVAMDKRGDVWIDDLNWFTIRKISAVDGSVLASVDTGRRPTYLVTDRNGSLVVASNNDLTGPLAAVHIDRFTSDGSYIDGVDLRTLFPPGMFAPLQFAAPTAVPTPFGPGITRVLATSTGALWLGVIGSACNPVIRLNPNLTLASSYGLYQPWAMVPDEGEGVWVFYNNGVATQYPINAPPMAGVPLQGWVHLSQFGQVLDSIVDGAAAGNWLTPSLGQKRYDGRQFQYNMSPAYIPARIWVHDPTSTASQMFPLAEAIDLISLGLVEYMAGFHLDGAQRLWALQNTSTGNQPMMDRWVRFPVEPPYSSYMMTEIGMTPLLSPLFLQTFYFTTYWGNASLFEYVHYTDPYGDLDGDGVMNHVELANFSNPLLPYGFSPAATATGSGGGPGGVFTVDYTVPGDQGLAYAAPFALVQPHFEPLGGGHFLPVSLTDPLVQLSLQPGTPGIAGTLGILDAQGGASASIQIPPVPGLSGLPFATCIATRDPNLPLLFKTVSRAFQFTIP